MRAPEDIVVPCRTFGVRVRLASGSGMLTPIEQLALQAIGAGLDDIDGLDRLLSIGQRPLLDLIHDLWLQGYVIVDMHGGTLHLSGSAKQAYEKGDFGGFKTAERNYELIELMQELVSGAIMPSGGSSHPFGSPSALVPTELTGLSLEHVGQAQLMAAIRVGLARERTRQSGRGRGFINALDVVEAWLEPDQLHLIPSAAGTTVQQQRYLGLEVDVTVDSDSGRLVFEVLGPPEIPALTRRDIGRELGAMADRMPDQYFFRHLRDLRSEDARPVRVSAEVAIERLLARTTDLDETNPGVLEARQSELIDLLDDAEAAMSQLARSQAEATVIVGRPDHDEAIRKLVGEAERQLVFANPWIDFDTLIRELGEGQKSWLQLIEDALAKGVQCVLLWGIKDDSRLDPKVQQAFYALTNRYPEHLRFSPRAAGLHAKFIVCDDLKALVTSYNFLHPGASIATLELGVLVEPPSRATNRSCEMALELLRWSRRNFPEYEVGRRVLFTADDFGIREPSTRFDAERFDAHVTHQPSPPEPPVSSLPAIRHWAQQWRAHAERLRALHRQFRCTVEFIEDGQHRDVLWSALRDCRGRLVVFSDRLSVDVVNDRFVARVESRLEAGVRCHFGYRREGASDLISGPAARLRALARRTPLCTIAEADNHAKVLIADDVVTIGSFNFLSYEGEYRAGRRERSEISARIRDPRVTADVLRQLAGVVPPAVVAARVEAPQLAIPADVVPPGLHPLFRQLAEADDPAEPLGAWFSGSVTPWAHVRSLHEAGVDPTLLARAVGAALAGGHVDVGSVDARYWRAWLADRFWARADFVGAALVLPADARSPNGLSTALARLGAEVQLNGPITSTHIAPDGASAAFYLALLGLLRHNRSECRVILEAAQRIGQAPYAEWAGAALAFSDTLRDSLPLDLLKRHVAERERERAVQEGHRMLQRALVRAESMYFSFLLGERTWGWLQRSDELLGRMRSHYERHDARACLTDVRALPEDEEELKEALDNVLDDASHAAQPGRLQEIGPPKRLTARARLVAVVHAARHWAEAAVERPLNPQESWQLAACNTLRQQLDPLHDGQTDALSEPPHRALIMAIEPLFSARPA